MARNDDYSAAAAAADGRATKATHTDTLVRCVVELIIVHTPSRFLWSKRFTVNRTRAVVVRVTKIVFAAHRTSREIVYTSRIHRAGTFEIVSIVITRVGVCVCVSSGLGVMKKADGRRALVRHH